MGSAVVERSGMSLAKRLTLVTAGVYLVFVAALGVATIGGFGKEHEEAIANQQLLLADLAARDIDARLALGRTLLEAELPALKLDGASFFDSALEFLAMGDAAHAFFAEGLAVRAADGSLVVAIGPRRWEPRTGPVPTVTTYSGPVPSATDPTEPAVVLTTPVRDASGRLLGAFEGAANLYSPHLLATYVNARIGHDGYFSLSTADRTVILHRDRDRVLRQQPPNRNAAVERGLAGTDGAWRNRTVAGIEMITAVRHVPTTGWVLAANYPMVEAEAPFTRALRVSSLVIVLAGVALAGLVWLSTRRLTRPLVAMTAQAHQLVAGNTEVREVRVASTDEVGELAGVINRLLADLAQGREALRLEAEETHRARAALRESEERFRVAFKTHPDPLALARLDDGVMIAVNDGFTALHGLDERDVVGRPSQTLPVWVHPEERHEFAERVRREGSVSNLDIHLRDAHGRERLVAISGRKMTLGGVEHILSISRDVTDERLATAERDRLSAQMALLERLAATGRLAAGVAHEINNPLTYVLGNLEAARDLAQKKGDDEQVQLLETAREGAIRVRDIVRDLRVFARRGDEDNPSADVAVVARSAVSVTANEVRHRAALRLELPDAAPVAMSERRLGQVLVNLLVNACKAIPEGRATQNEIALVARADDERVVITVSDTGVGMTPDVQQRLFEPFFTTRDAGEGMGLGLAICHTLVTDAGGQIVVDSAPGRGTRFTVTLPRAKPRAAAAPMALRAQVPGAPAAPDGLRVLVVDDEPMIGQVIRRALAKHTVVVTTSAAEALAQLRGGAHFDAVLCDLMMPDVTGMDLHAALVAELPEMARRMVFLTGGAFTDRARSFLDHLRAPVLDKPLSLQALRDAITQVTSADGGKSD